jgi:drug/metabolite transporter (DMT)-like permease
VTRFAALLALAAAFLIVGSSVVAAKAMVQMLPVFLASLLRFLIAAAVLLVLHAALLGWRMRTTFRQDVALFGQALAGQVLFTAFLLLGLRHTGAIDAAILYATLPGVVALLARLLIGEALKPHTRDGAALSLAGAVALNIGYQAGQAASLGIGLVFLAVVAHGVYAVLGKWTARLPALTVVTAMNLHGVVLFLPFGVHEGLRLDWSAVPPLAWFLVVYLAVVQTTGAFLLFYAASVRLDSRVARAFTAFVPLSAAVLAGVFLGEATTSVHLMAGVLVLSGLLVIALGRRASR